MAGPGSPDQFMVSIDRWTEKAKLAPMVVVKETVQTMNNEIVEGTPVKSGFLRGSYFAALNRIPFGQGSPGLGGASSAAINAVVGQIKPGDTYIMGNTASYSRRVELGFVGIDSLGRRYIQRGRYFMRSVLARANLIAEAAAARVAAQMK